jgi:hypothetical protein
MVKDGACPSARTAFRMSRHMYLASGVEAQRSNMRAGSEKQEPVRGSQAEPRTGSNGHHEER